jgi:hypothetical protein
VPSRDGPEIDLRPALRVPPFEDVFREEERRVQID